MEIGTYEAKTHLPELRPVAHADPAALREALARLDRSRARLRAKGVKVSRADILAAIREGRR